MKTNIEKAEAYLDAIKKQKIAAGIGNVYFEEDVIVAFLAGMEESRKMMEAVHNKSNNDETKI